MDKCKINECTNIICARNWCSKHYQRWQKHGDTNYQFNLKKCFINDCKYKYYAKGLCSMHYKRWHRHGDPTIVKSHLGREKIKTKKSIQSPTLRDIEWSAGFCEGEASFNESRVQLSQTESRTPLQKMLDLFGGNIVKRSFVKRRLKGIKARDAEIWIVSGSRARGFMMTIYSLMSPKRQKQIRRALNK